MTRLSSSLLVCTALAVPVAAAAQSTTELISLGDSAHARFDAQAALNHYQAAIGFDSVSAEALAKASRTSVDLGEAETDRDRRTALYRQGESFARRAVALDSSRAENWFHLARALGRAALTMGVRDQVKYAVEIRDCGLKALVIDPDHAGALHVLGMWNAEVKRLNGFELFFARNFLGGGVLGQANWKDAVAYLERAVQIDPDRLTHHLDLAGIYADTGEKDKARAAYRFVVEATVRTDVNDPLYKRQAEEALRRLR
ncbi:MAG TPA: tetratricopeptide repeat protein [Gemmatimonadaceae bacterium]|jgi:tetratricopeptide (TPR) repeat protein